jgi:hypothetical protein
MVTSAEHVTAAVDPIPPRLAGTIPRFVVGHEYNRRDDIHLNYGGSRQSGISSSSACPAIFLFTGDTGEQYGYRDDFDSEDVFSYTGEGQVGDMEFKAGNRAIRDHAVDGRALYLFRSQGKGKSQRYMVNLFWPTIQFDGHRIEIAKNATSSSFTCFEWMPPRMLPGLRVSRQVPYPLGRPGGGRLRLALALLAPLERRRFALFTNEAGRSETTFCSEPRAHARPALRTYP